MASQGKPKQEQEAVTSLIHVLNANSTIDPDKQIAAWTVVVMNSQENPAQQIDCIFQLVDALDVNQNGSAEKKGKGYQAILHAHQAYSCKQHPSHDKNCETCKSKIIKQTYCLRGLSKILQNDGWADTDLKDLAGTFIRVAQYVEYRVEFEADVQKIKEYYPDFNRTPSKRPNRFQQSAHLSSQKQTHHKSRSRSQSRKEKWKKR